MQRGSVRLITVCVLAGGMAAAAQPQGSQAVPSPPPSTTTQAPGQPPAGRIGGGKTSAQPQGVRKAGLTAG